MVGVGGVGGWVGGGSCQITKKSQKIIKPINYALYFHGRTSFSLTFSVSLSLTHPHPRVLIHTPDENVKGTVDFNGIQIRVYDSCRA